MINNNYLKYNKKLDLNKYVIKIDEKNELYKDYEILRNNFIQVYNKYEKFKKENNKLLEWKNNHICNNINIKNINNSEKFRSTIFESFEKQNIKNKNILKEEDYGCYVYLFKNKDNEIRIKCSEKTQYDVKYYYDLYEKCKQGDKKDYDAFDDPAIYMLNARGTAINSKNKEKYRNKIKKCKEIYDLYGDDLDFVYFSISSMANIRNKEKWKSWKIYLGNKINEIKNNNKE